jgi:hypothetical protein
MTCAMAELRRSPAFSKRRRAFLAALAYDHYIAIAQCGRFAARAAGPWKNFMRARGFCPSDVLFGALGAVVSTASRESWLSQRLYRRWNHTPLYKADRLHCNALRIAFDGDASVAEPSALPTTTVMPLSSPSRTAIPSAGRA